MLVTDSNVKLTKVRIVLGKTNSLTNIDLHNLTKILHTAQPCNILNASEVFRLQAQNSKNMLTMTKV